jgi:hypothetical protein
MQDLRTQTRVNQGALGHSGYLSSANSNYFGENGVKKDNFQSGHKLREISTRAIVPEDRNEIAFS